MVTGNLYIQDRWNNLTGYDDVTSGEATAGDVTVYELKFTNVSNGFVDRLKAWLDPSAIKDDHELALGETDLGPWVQPLSPDDSLALFYNTVPVGQSKSIYVQRTVTAGAVYDPDILSYIKYSFSSI